MNAIKNNEGKAVSGVVVLKTYFGMHPGQTLSEFMTEVKQLKEVDKDELIIGACKELGWTIA